MKKILVSAAALGLMAGVATSAAALELKTTGKYEVDGFYFNSGAGAAGGGGVAPWNDATLARVLKADVKAEADDWWEHRMYVNADLIVNDKVKMISQVRFINKHSIWGTQDDGVITDGGGFEVKLMFLDYDSPIGKFQVGRRNAGAWGLPFVDSATHADRLFWYLPVPKPFNAYVFTEKQKEVDGYTGATLYNNGVLMSDGGDQDKDYYEAAFGFKNDAFNVLLGYGKLLDNSATANIQTTDAVTKAVTTTYGKEVDMNRIKGYGTAKFGAFTLQGEFDWKFGTTDFNKVGVADQDKDAWAYFLAGQAVFGNLTTTLAYAHIDGEDKAADSTAYDTDKGTGADFEPLYILTGSAANIFNGDRGANLVGTAMRTAGVDALVALVDFKVTEPLTLHAGIGYGMADNTDMIGANVDDEYGWEIDLGVAYQVYKNLTYEVRFGYWMVGDFAKLGNSLNETEDVMQLSHHLTMKF